MLAIGLNISIVGAGGWFLDSSLFSVVVSVPYRANAVRDLCVTCGFPIASLSNCYGYI